MRRFHPWTGGTERYVLDVARMQARRGHHVRVLTLDRDVLGDGARPPRHELLDGIEILRVPGRGGPRWALTTRPLEVGRSIDWADVVHQHDLRFHPGLTAAAAVLRRRPVLFHTHGLIFHTAHDARLKQALVRLYYGPLMRAGRGVVVCDSEADRRRLLALAPALRGRALHVPDALDVSELTGLEPAPVPGRIVVFGRVAPSKGIDRMIVALAGLLPPWHLVIAGRAEADHEAMLAGVAARCGVADRVTLAGPYPDGGLADLLRRAAVAAFPSRGEGFGLALVEALAAGLPVVASDLPSHHEILGDELAGSVVDFDDAASVARGLDRVTGTPEALARSRAGAARRVTRFQIERLADDLDLITRRLLDGTAGGPAATDSRDLPGRAGGAGAPATRLLMGVPIHDLPFEESTASIVGAVEGRRPLTVATPNLDHLVRADRDPAFRDALLAADLRVPDGMWVVYASRIAGRPLRGTTTGRLLIPALAAEAAHRGWGIALVGGPPGVAAAAADRLRAAHPTLRIDLADAPPMGFRVGDHADRALVERLAATDARIVFIGLGAPRQELWMAAHRAELGGRALLGIGAGIDIVAGRFREAPAWMTRTGMEWAFRLAQEPRRLARRYLVDDPRVLAWAIRARLGRA